MRMSDLRPDIVFVVSGDVWRDFCALRDQWGHSLAKGLVDACVGSIRQAIKDGDPATAAHWKAVRELAIRYGVSWVSAVEVDGVVIQEEGELSALRHPPLLERKRVVIDGYGRLSMMRSTGEPGLVRCICPPGGGRSGLSRVCA